MTPKAVFWDMDGTLVDSEPLHEQALAAALQSVGITPPADLHDRVVGIAARPVYEMMRDEFGLGCPFDDWIVRKYDHYMRTSPRLNPRPGAIEIFQRAEGARAWSQAVVSNSDRLIVDANLRTVGMVYPGMKTISRNDVRERQARSRAFPARRLADRRRPGRRICHGGQPDRRHGRACRRHEDDLLAAGSDGRAARRASKASSETERSGLSGPRLTEWLSSGRRAPARRGSPSARRDGARPGRDSRPPRWPPSRRSRRTARAADGRSTAP